MNQDQVLELVRTRGPLVPSQISKDLNTNILLASAILSEFASRNLVKVSSIKVGGSPLYYVVGQEDKLQDFLPKLNEVEKRACELLRERKVLRDIALDPQTRVALRSSRDFAKPLEVTIDKQKEIFWKWYMVDNSEVEQMIKAELSMLEQKAKAKEQSEKKVEPKLKAEPKLDTKPKKISEQIMETIKPKLARAEVDQKLEPKAEVFSKLEQKPEHKMSADPFSRKLSDFFSGKSISVADEKIIKKNAEIQYLIKVPSAVGETMYFCYAKSKKTITEQDLSYALVQGQIKKLPVLFLAHGELTKRAAELIAAHEFGNLTLVQV